jgi:hypothetical protein
MVNATRKNILPLLVEKRRQTHFLSPEEEEKWIDDYVEREKTGA